MRWWGWGLLGIVAGAAFVGGVALGLHWADEWHREELRWARGDFDDGDHERKLHSVHN